MGTVKVSGAYTLQADLLDNVLTAEAKEAIEASIIQASEFEGTETAYSFARMVCGIALCDDTCTVDDVFKEVQYYVYHLGMFESEFMTECHNDIMHILGGKVC